MKRIIVLATTLAISLATAFSGERHIAFERDNSVYIANLDGSGERKIADGIFPAISPDGTRVALNTVEKTSDTTYVRHIAVTDVVSGKTTVFKDIPSDNSYYATWSPDGKRILFTLRQNEVWDFGLINVNDVSPDGKHLLLSIEMNEEANRKDWDGPLPALWSFDLDSQRAVRLTSKKLLGWDGVWLDNDNILLLSRAAGEKDDSIYRMSINRKNSKRLIKNARFPSVNPP